MQTTHAELPGASPGQGAEGVTGVPGVPGVEGGVEVWVGARGRGGDGPASSSSWTVLEVPA